MASCGAGSKNISVPGLASALPAGFFDSAEQDAKVGRNAVIAI